MVRKLYLGCLAAGVVFFVSGCECASSSHSHVHIKTNPAGTVTTAQTVTGTETVTVKTNPAGTFIKVKDRKVK